MTEELIPEAELFDAVQVAAAKLEGMDWRQMQTRAVAYAVLAEAVPHLKLALAGREDDDEASRQQRAHDALSAQTRERYPWIHGGG